MEHFTKLHQQVTLRIIAAVSAMLMVLAGIWLACVRYLGINEVLAAAATGGIGLALTVLLAKLLANMALTPLRTLQQAILHVTPEHHGTAAPDLQQLRLGRELIGSLALQVYQFASMQANSGDAKEHREAIIQASNIVSHMPLPLFVLNKDLLVTNASMAAFEYCGAESANVFGKPLFDNLNLEFRSDNTLEQWMQECQNSKVTDTGYWERVRVRSKDGNSFRQCDVSAYYNRDNPSGTDFIVTIFDRTTQYNQDDESMGFIALAVHELRTPLTMLRGYIEVFEEELSPQLNSEMKDFMLKMEASAKQLTSFVHNILNVARVENNQLALHLHEADWGQTLEQCLRDVELRARVRGKQIDVQITGDIPTVAVDAVSVNEVINNLIDNAIKYSGESKQIVVHVGIDTEGMVATTVQDFGVGIPQSVLPNLFEKFYRNHRTRTQIGGTGLGLFLCKSIVEAHGGRIWASSKEGEGSTFGFTLVPYANLATELKGKNAHGIERQANGWIKNHTLYRR